LVTLDARAAALPARLRSLLATPTSPEEPSSSPPRSGSEWQVAGAGAAAEAAAHRSATGAAGGKGKRPNGSQAAPAEVAAACAELPLTPALTAWYSKWDEERGKRAGTSKGGGRRSAKGGGKAAAAAAAASPPVQKPKQQLQSRAESAAFDAAADGAADETGGETEGEELENDKGEDEEQGGIAQMKPTLDFD
jgi:hypothetical protein